MTQDPYGRGFGFLFEMGCGKTLTAISVMGALYEAGRVQSCLVIAPTTVVPVWPEEMAEKADFPFLAATMLGTKRKRQKAYQDMIRTYERLGTNPLLMPCINYNEIFREGIQNLLEEFHADLIILDEGHYIKNHTAKTSKEAYALGESAHYRLLLTGTPLTNHTTDLYGEFRFVDRRVFGSNFYAFRNRYCIMGGFQNKKVVGEKNHDELVKRVHSAALRVTKADALDLPEETTVVRYVELSRTEREVYENLRKTGLAELEGGAVTAPLVITKMLRLQQVCGGFVKLDEEESPQQIGTSKLDTLEDIVRSVVLDEDQKLVVFARFLPEVHAICGMLDGLGLQYGCIYGEIPQEERGRIVSEFQRDPEVRVFVAQIQTAGLGITLHAASTAVFYSMDFSYANYAQAMARIHRIGQRFPCTYINLIARGTIDEKIQNAMQDKADLAAGICDGWRDVFMAEGAEYESD